MSRTALPFVLILIGLLVGCASQRSLLSELEYLSLLPEDADIYLSFPVEENRTLANGLVRAMAPSMAEKDVENLVNRFAGISAALSDDEVTAIVTGAFPTAGLGFVLTERNGWSEIRDKGIPITGRYYEYRGLSYQFAFPSSSAMVIAPQVYGTLAGFQQSYRGMQPSWQNPLLAFPSGMAVGAIDFYIADTKELVMPLLTELPINLPLKAMYGRFLPVVAVEEQEGSEGGRLYYFSAYLVLTDERATGPALAAVRILARALGFNFTAVAFGESMIEVSGIILGEETLLSLLSGIISGDRESAPNK